VCCAMHGDAPASLDLHDILVLLYGRPRLAGEIAADLPQVRAYIATELAHARRDPYFPDLLESALQDYPRVAVGRAKRLEPVVNRIGAHRLAPRPTSEPLKAPPPP
jgi:hypothetical protein